MITYQIESIRDCIKEIELLFKDHYDEVEKDQAIVEFDPDIDMLFLLEDQDILKLFTVRDGIELAGYYLSLITPSINNKNTIQSTEIGFFIKKGNRSASLGLKLLRYVESQLTVIGVDCLLASTKVNYPCDPLFIRVGMKLNERQYIKHLGK